MSPVDRYGGRWVDTLSDRSAHWYPCVVVADDDADFAEMLRVALGSAGMCVHPIGSGTGALSLMNAVPVDLLLMDVGMPGDSGLDVLAQMQTDPWLRRVPVILVTGRARAADVDRGLSAGADLYVTKPLSPRELIRQIRELLDSRR